MSHSIHPHAPILLAAAPARPELLLWRRVQSASAQIQCFGDDVQVAGHSLWAARGSTAAGAKADAEAAATTSRTALSIFATRSADARRKEKGQNSSLVKSPQTNQGGGLLLFFPERGAVCVGSRESGSGYAVRVLTPAAEPTNAPRRCPQTRFAARCGDGSCSLLRRCEQRTNNYRHSTATTRNPTVTALRQLRATAVTAGSNSWPRGKPEAERDCSNAQAGLVKRASAFAQDACCDSGRSKRLADPGCCTLATTCGPLVSVFGGPGGDACSRFDGENTCAACPPWRAAPPMTTEPRADGGVLVAGRGGLRLGAAA